MEYRFDRYGITVRQSGSLFYLVPEEEGEEHQVVISRARRLGMEFDDPSFRTLVTNFPEWMADNAPEFELVFRVRYDLSGFSEDSRVESRRRLRNWVWKVGEALTRDPQLSPTPTIRVIRSTFGVNEIRRLEGE